ncbi:MAG: galactose mutarotase [Alphaproteobacteria bacterium]|nr:galactose mutarotase [Alphaproteobacteria bacterium]
MATFTVKDFGTLENGQKIQHFTLDSGNGCQVGISEYGAIITSVKYPDSQGKIDEVSLGFDNLPDYVNSQGSFGTTVGRYANRIGGAQFKLNGQIFKLEPNEGKNQLHGGANGFGFQPFKGTEVAVDNAVAVKLERLSLDGEAGYPGDLIVAVTYVLSHDNILTITYDATSNQDTYINLTNHAYFNLDGIADDGSSSILDHEITLNGSFIVPIDAESIPTGEIRPVDNTPFDLRQPTLIRKGTENPDAEMRQVNNGYDINYIVGADDGKMKQHAYIKAAHSGRALKVVSTQPCVQFYSGPHLSKTTLQNGKIVNKYAGFCLEAQDYPNGPNIAHFPTKPLRANDQYTQVIEYHFITE